MYLSPHNGPVLKLEYDRGNANNIGLNDSTVLKVFDSPTFAYCLKSTLTLHETKQNYLEEKTINKSKTDMDYVKTNQTFEDSREGNEGIYDEN